MRGPREPVSSRYSDIGHYHITRDPGIPAAPDLASGKLSSSVTQIQSFCQEDDLYHENDFPGNKMLL